MARWQRPTPPMLLTLALGILFGWSMAAVRPVSLRAQGGDRWEDSILSTGPTFVRYNEGSRVQVAQDAVYYLDYRTGTLVGTIPTMRQVAGSTRIFDAFAERDLAADFKLDLDNGPRPHFLMTTGAIAQGSGGGYGDGWAPLFVFESTTRQVGVYRIVQQQVGATTQTRLDLLELRSFGKVAAAPVR